MKHYYINGSCVGVKEFEKQLRRCCTKGTERGKHISAGANPGVLDYTHYNDVSDKLRAGWRYTCIYPPKQINMTFYIKE
nr:MAG TPA: hypothetical protein [Caudoviricetes sp.]